MFLLKFEFVFVVQCGNLDIFPYAYSISQVDLIVPIFFIFVEVWSSAMIFLGILGGPKWFPCQMSSDNVTI